MTPAVPIAPEATANRVGPPLLSYEATKADERVMLLEAFGEPDGHVTVDAEVWSVRSERREPVRSSYRFATTALATKFVDEAMIALEYLGCNVVDRGDATRD
jgi:hypothetical protein